MEESSEDRPRNLLTRLPSILKIASTLCSSCSCPDLLQLPAILWVKVFGFRESSHHASNERDLRFAAILFMDIFKSEIFGKYRRISDSSV